MNERYMTITPWPDTRKFRAKIIGLQCMLMMDKAAAAWTQQRGQPHPLLFLFPSHMLCVVVLLVNQWPPTVFLTAKNSVCCWEHRLRHHLKRWDNQLLSREQNLSLASTKRWSLAWRWSSFQNSNLTDVLILREEFQIVIKGYKILRDWLKKKFQVCQESNEHLSIQSLCEQQRQKTSQRISFFLSGKLKNTIMNVKTRRLRFISNDNSFIFLQNKVAFPSLSYCGIKMRHLSAKQNFALIVFLAKSDPQRQSIEANVLLCCFWVA